MCTLVSLGGVSGVEGNDNGTCAASMISSYKVPSCMYVLVFFDVNLGVYVCGELMSS